MNPYPNEHSARLTSPDKYKEFRRDNDKFGPGIDAIFGIFEKDGKRTSELQAIRFDKDKFSVAEAKAWLKEHDHKVVSFEAASGGEEKATTAPSSTSNLPRGQGGLFSLGQALGDDEENGKAALECVCPECGHRIPKKLRQPCNEIKCPECGTLMRLDTGESEKAIAEKVIRKEGNEIILYDSEGKKVLGRFPFGAGKKYKDEDSAREAAAKRERQIQYFKHEGASKFISYKDRDGSWRWLWSSSQPASAAVGRRYLPRPRSQSPSSWRGSGSARVPIWSVWQHWGCSSMRISTRLGGKRLSSPA